MWSLSVRLEPVRRGAAALAAVLTLGAAAVSADVLVEEDGVDAVYAYCTACHSEMIIAQQGQTREGWDKMLVWMVEEQGMAPIDEPDRTEVLDYLETHYNTDRPNFPR